MLAARILRLEVLAGLRYARERSKCNARYKHAKQTPRAHLQPEFIVLQINQSVRGKKCPHPVGRSQRQRLNCLFGRAQHLRQSHFTSHAMHTQEKIWYAQKDRQSRAIDQPYASEISHRNWNQHLLICITTL